jgi:glutathione S-transferase
VPFSIADLNVASILSFATFTGVELAVVPNVGRWLSACLSRPAAKTALSK